MATNNLVQGGHQRSNRTPISFVCDVPPVVHNNTHIVAVTHPTVSRGGPTDEGWFLSDFYAFNYLYHGLGASQVWLTAADPAELLKSYGVYLHGNPYQDRRVVLSQELLGKDMLTKVTVVKPTQMIDRFLLEVRKASEQAKRDNAPLLLLVFCHGIDNYHFLLDNGNREKGLGILQLKGQIDSGVRMTLVSTACYSGGWAVTEDLDLTAMTAAKETTTSNSWCRSSSIRRTCGSVFASSLIETLSSQASPLLLDPEQSASVQEPLQPSDPTEDQTKTYNEFCRSILEICEERVHRLWDCQHFCFSAQDDQWEHSWTGRAGIPLAHFEKRWNQLAVYPYRGTKAMRELKDPSPLNPAFSQEDADTSSTGRIRNDTTDDPTELLIASIRQHRIQEMARVFLTTCPGDWTRGQDVSLCTALEDCAEGRPITIELDADIQATLKFRWELGLLADHIIDCFGLPQPNNQPCLMWDRDVWVGIIQKKVPEWCDLHSFIFRKLVEEGCFIKGTDEQGPPFHRFPDYVSCALIEGHQSLDETMRKIYSIADFITQAKKFHEERACQQSDVRGRSKAWLQSIGRRVRKSPSPKKVSR